MTAPVARDFLDTNVLLYLLSGDVRRADAAERLVAGGGRISVQVLNEFSAVATRKLGLSIAEVREILGVVRRACLVHPVTVETHEQALNLVERYRLAYYDAAIVAAALETGCTRLYSEDLPHGQVFERRLRVHNPFATQRPA